MLPPMTLPSLAASAGVSMLLAAIGVRVLRATLRARANGPEPDSLSLRFQTSTAKERRGWSAFWARDPFVQAHRERKGIAFGTYDVPGGEQIATHFAPGDMLQHTLILGATGSGKSSLLEQLALFRLRTDRPFTLIDLHGDLFTRVASWALLEKAQRDFPLTLIDFTQPDLLPVWNPLTRIDGVDVGRQVDLLVGVLKRLYAGESAASWAWGVKVEELTRWALRAILESATPLSLVDLKSFFLMPDLRARVLATASAESRAYWTGRYERTKQDEQYVSAVLNKLEPFLGSVAVQRFLGGPTSSFDLLGAMDRGETVIVNLAKGYLGPTADVTGRLLMNALQIAALQRERIAPAKTAASKISWSPHASTKSLSRSRRRGSRSFRPRSGRTSSAIPEANSSSGCRTAKRGCSRRTSWSPSGRCGASRCARMMRSTTRS